MKRFHCLGVATTFITGFVLLFLLTFSAPASAQSCGELGGDYCSQSGQCPAGYDSLGSSWDCNPCCKEQPPSGPSCGELGGDYCSQSGFCPGGYDSLGSTWDCNPCCKQQPPLPSCGELGGDYCSQSDSCPSGYDSLGSSYDCHPCCKKQPPSGPSCGEMGGGYCSQSGSCPEGYDSLGSSWDCRTCCKQMAPTDDNAKIVSHTIPESMIAGESYKVSVTMLNTGMTTWTSHGGGPPDGSQGYQLAVKSGLLIPVGFRVLLPLGKEVQPGESHTFEFSIIAPLLGFASTQLQMIHGGVGWFGETLSLRVQIEPEEIPRSTISLTPESGPPGTIVTLDLIEGLPFRPEDQIRFSFGDPEGHSYSRVPVSFTWVNSSQMTFTVPQDADCGSHFAVVREFGRTISDPAEFSVTGPCNPSRMNSLNVLTYNVAMVPAPNFWPVDKCNVWCETKEERAKLIPYHPDLQGHDVIVFQEAFSNGHRKSMLAAFSPEYPYTTSIQGHPRFPKPWTNGGVIVLSKWPIEVEREMSYGICGGVDCYADKGVLYARVNKAGQPYHIFGTHLDADVEDEDDWLVRVFQLYHMKDFIDRMEIPSAEPVLMAGDFNIDRHGTDGEYDFMLKTLDASFPLPRYPFPLGTNPNGQWLDYVLYSNRHAKPAQAFSEVRYVSYPWFLRTLSDHYAVLGSFVFPISENLAENSSKDRAVTPIGGEPSGTMSTQFPAFSWDEVAGAESNALDANQSQ